MTEDRAANRISIRMPGVPMLYRYIQVTFEAGDQR
ncbi:MAG: hypothetical protein CFH10_01642 [Alphaproteobacteria bacterium MarineAlpha4_Bin2]|nr:MAG: hypothetical protein CFH10_01642 [Alphaproteobacteria bacterium MarineAlpha4_Bin2]